MKWVMYANVVGKEYRQLRFEVSPFNKNEEWTNVLDRILWSMRQIRTSRLERCGFYKEIRLDAVFSLNLRSVEDYVSLTIFLVKDNDERIQGALEFNELEFAKWVCSGL